MGCFEGSRKNAARVFPEAAVIIKHVCDTAFDVSWWLQAAADTSTATSLFGAAFGGNGCWWLAIWRLDLFAGALLPYTVGFALGCLYRVADPALRHDPAPLPCPGCGGPTSRWPYCVPHGGLLRVESHSAHYSHLVVPVWAGGRHYSVLRDAPSSVQPLLVVGRPVWDPSSVAVAVPGTPLPPDWPQVLPPAPRRLRQDRNETTVETQPQSGSGGQRHWLWKVPALAKARSDAKTRQADPAGSSPTTIGRQEEPSLSTF